MLDILTVYYIVGIIGGTIIALNAVIALAEKIYKFVSTHFRNRNNG